MSAVIVVLSENRKNEVKFVIDNVLTDWIESQGTSPGTGALVSCADDRWETYINTVTCDGAELFSVTVEFTPLDLVGPTTAVVHYKEQDTTVDLTELTNWLSQNIVT